MPAGERVARLCHMRPFIPRPIVALLVLAGLLVPAAASAVTVDEIVALARAGVTDAVILALIDRDKTIYTLEWDQLLMLKNDGVSEPVILAMLRSGREEGDRAAQAATDLKTAMYLSERSPGPEVVIIGHGPETPNAYSNDVYSGTGNGYALPYAGGYGYGYGYGGRRGRGRMAPFLPYATSPPDSIFRNTAPMFVPMTLPANIPVIPPVNIPVIPPVARPQMHRR